MQRSDKEIILEIISHAFVENPRTQAMMKKKDPVRSVRLMAEYAYDLITKFNGIYLSEDKSTVLFYYKNSEYRRSFVDYIKYARMFLRAIRPSQLLPTLKREKIIKDLRPDYEDYIYVWLLGSDQKTTSIKGLADIRDHLFGLSKELNLPILIETTVEKVIKLYRFVGFEEYHRWVDEEAGFDVWFMKREPELD